MADNDFLKFSRYFIKILIFWKILIFDKNRDNGNVCNIVFLIFNKKFALKTFLQMPEDDFVSELFKIIFRRSRALSFLD